MCSNHPSRGYPTKEQILAKPMLHPPEVIRFVKAWKRHPVKVRSLIELLSDLAGFYKKPLNHIRFLPDIPSSFYIPSKKTIVLKDNSVLTALHEFAHHLKGRSELTACRWSIWLFKKCFPKAYLQLTWKGHMLCRAKDTTKTEIPQKSAPAENAKE